LFRRSLTGRTTGGIWLSFFLIQVPFIAGERLLLSALKRRGTHLPGWLRNLATALVIVASGQFLFWPPAKQWGVVDSSVGNVKDFLLHLAGSARAALA